MFNVWFEKNMFCRWMRPYWHGWLQDLQGIVSVLLKMIQSWCVLILNSGYAYWYAWNQDTHRPRSKKTHRSSYESQRNHFSTICGQADWHEQHFCGLQQAFGPWRFSWKFHSWNFHSQKSTLDRIDICAKISFRNHRKLFIAFSKRQNCFLELQELSF